MNKSTTATFRAEIGQHAVIVDHGVARVLFSGRVSVEEARDIANVVFDFGDKFGRLPVLVDLDSLVDFDSGARAVFARPSKPYPFSTVAYFGGNFATRTLILTIVRAGKLIAPKEFGFAISGFATEAEARRFLEEVSRKNQAGT